MQTAFPYPVPGPTGGVLIRRLVKFFKTQNFNEFIGDGKLCVLVSGGVDSVALAVLISKYGRRILNPSRMTWIHFDHGWRAESATVEKHFVESLAVSLGCEFQSFRLKAPVKGEVNAESFSRNQRLLWIKENVGDQEKQYRVALTAHHSDDVVETLLWRFFRGQWNPKYRFGIRGRKGRVFRPLLSTSKNELAVFLKEEKISAIEDPTNSDSRFFRAWLRNEVLPLIESRYPNFRKTLLRRVG